MAQHANQAMLLVIEDDPATREFFAELLTYAGYHVRTAGSGREGITMLAQYPAAMLVLDRRLPDMDGIDVCREIRATLDATIPIILVSGDYSPELQAAAKAAGVTTYLPKPFLPDVLLECIVALLQ